MVIAVDPDLEARLTEAARKQGVTPEELALGALREKFSNPTPPIEPRDEWERNLLAIGTNCGVSLSDEAVSSEELYD